MLGRPSLVYKTPVDLVDDVRGGIIRVPPFQRGFKWQAKDVLKLFDSLLRGYPVGSLLLWQRPAPPQRIALGPLVVDVGEVISALWVVDGQQRITSIVGALTSAGTAQDPRFRIYLDASAQQFHALGLRQEAPAGWVPVSVLLDTATLLRWTRDHLDRFTESEMSAVDVAAKAMREYQIPTYVVKTADEGELKEIFTRMNETGRPLSKAESFQALHHSTSGAQAATLAGIGRTPAQIGFGAIDDRLALRCVLAFQGGDIFRDDFHGEFASESAREEAFRGTARALLDAVAFLQQDVGIPHVRLLPYSHVVPVLVRFIRIHGVPDGRAAVLLRRWVWRSAVVGAKSRGISVVDIRQQVRLAGSQRALEAAQHLLERMPNSLEFAVDLDKIHLNHAMARINALGLLAAGPVDLPTGQPAEPASLLEGDGLWHEIARGRGRAGANSVANRVVSSWRSGLDIGRALAEAPAATQVSHLVDAEALKSLVSHDWPAFLARRSHLAERAITAHVARMAEWGARDGQEISAIVRSVA